MRKRALQIILRVETWIVIDIVSHVVDGLDRNLSCDLREGSNVIIVGEKIKAGHPEMMESMQGEVHQRRLRTVSEERPLV